MLKALPLTGEKKRPAALLLGSFPGVESLRRKQYYAHPRNLFWPLLSAALGTRDPENYNSRLRLLKTHRLALCDTLQGCIRSGSLDSAIKTAVPNSEVSAFLRRFPRTPVLFTSKKAHALFTRYFTDERGDREEFCLPSPSPANAAQSRAAKTRLWKKIFARVNGDGGKGL